MKKNNQQKSPGCLYILFNVFVVMLLNRFAAPDCYC